MVMIVLMWRCVLKVDIERPNDRSRPYYTSIQIESGRGLIMLISRIPSRSSFHAGRSRFSARKNLFFVRWDCLILGPPMRQVPVHVSWPR